MPSRTDIYLSPDLDEFQLVRIRDWKDGYNYDAGLAHSSNNLCCQMRSLDMDLRTRSIPAERKTAVVHAPHNRRFSSPNHIDVLSSPLLDAKSA